MRAQVLIDLFVPARLGSPRELQFAAAKSGLDAILRVVEDPSELPSPDELGELDPEGPAVLTATAVVGPGFRFACLLPVDRNLSLESLEATGDPRLIQSTVAELGGLALPVAPRQGTAGAVSRQAPTHDSARRFGVVALTIAGSRLGRDLDLEDTVIAERVILGGSGPFATLDEVGRYASLVPVAVHEVGAESTGKDAARRVSIEALAKALAAGRGFAVELAVKRPQLWVPDPSEGRDDTSGEPQRKRRRRRRASKPQA